MVGAVKSGEVTGKLNLVLRELAEALGKAAHFRSLALSAMTYPTIILLFSLVVSIAMVVFLVPNMLQGLEGVAGEN